MSKICQIILSADVFTTKENLNIPLCSGEFANYRFVNCGRHNNPKAHNKGKAGQQIKVDVDMLTRRPRLLSLHLASSSFGKVT